MLAFARLRHQLPRAEAASALSLHGSRRGLLPLPAIAAAAVKFGGAAVLKKVALSKVIQKIGPDRTLHELRAMNGKLRAKGVLNDAVADAAEESLQALDRSLTSLRGDERIGAVWAWYTTLEKSNPTFAAAILKTWLEGLPGIKWASAVLNAAPKPPDGLLARGASDGGASDSGSSHGAAASNAASVDGDAAHAAVIQELRKSHPALLDRYHVVLVPREDGVDVEATRRD